MKTINRILSLLLAAVLVLSLVPGYALADQWQTAPQSVGAVNPRYADLFTIADIDRLLGERDHTAVRPQATTPLPLEEAAAVLRDGMIARQERINISFFSTHQDYQAASDELFALAMAHTGDPKGGDCIMWQYAGWGGSLSRTAVAGGYQFSGYFDCYYYTTAEQEAELDRAVEKLLADLDLQGKTDYEKISKVYTYICDNITYDYEHLSDPNYILMYTPYAALINKTAVCQGYATLFYRMMLELDVDCRVIAGDGGGPHGWNIVALDGLYYNVDATWDAGNFVFYWFMKSFWGFGQHERYMEYDTIAFHNEYPMSALDHRDYYVEGIEPYMDPYIYAAYANEDHTVIWYLNRNGTIEFDGAGDCHDYPVDEWPLHGLWADEITGLWVGEGVTGLGTYSFYDYRALKKAEFPTTLTSLREGCFRDCVSMTEVYFTGDAPAIAGNTFTGVTATAYYPSGNATWTADKLQNYGGNLTWVPIVPAHDHSYTPAVTAPTCTEQGYTTYTCTICGDSYVSDHVSALGHDLGTWTTVTAPTCTEPGTEQRNCSRCDHTESRSIAATGHHHEAVVTPPTCTEAGFTTYTCACGDSYVSDYVEALGHDLGDWITVTAPTCTEEGTEQRNCARCGHTESRAIAATGHHHEAVVTPPTCTEAGFTTYTCACGDSYVSDYVEALGHDLGDWITVTAPTCTEEGTEQRNCARCGHTESRAIAATGHHHEAVVTPPTCTEAGFTTYTCVCGDSYVSDPVPALGHSWDEGVVTKEPTEEEAGEKLRTCLVCGATKTDTIPPLTHTHSYESVTTAPTCTEQGYTTYTCACGDSYVSDYGEALGHDLGDWATVTAPTCTEEGTEQRNCSRCGHTESRAIAATGHHHEAVVTAPTCTEQGYTTYTCACGDSYVSDYVAALDHDLGDWITVTAPTCTESGTEQRNCSRCDHTETRTAAALGHDYVNGICARCGAEDPNYQPPAENPFTDVPEGSFYYDPVLWAVEEGITNGATADTFNPGGQCQRAHVVTFLWRAAGQPEPTTTQNPFEDVKESDFYYKAVLWAVENGITNGVDATHFGPFAYCNRAQVVTFLYRAMGNPEVPTAECPFTDVEAGAWYEAPILWAVANGITNGMDATTFGVNTICNRAQVVTFLYRTYVN